MEQLEGLTPGMPVVWGGRWISRVDPELANMFQAGDRLLVDPSTGELLHVPQAEELLARAAVDSAVDAFGRMGAVSDIAVSAFYGAFAGLLAQDSVWSVIRAANEGDVIRARERGRSVTRLLTTDSMRAAMISGLREWRDAEPTRGRVIETVRHPGWSVSLETAPLGVVGFVFEARPNVFADATGVLRGGNTVVFRIGSDALGTARAIVDEALQPALRDSGLPSGAVQLIPSGHRAAGWALFSDPRLALAVARGSGKAADQLGGIARQAGVPVSLHGTGGAWIVAHESARLEDLRKAVYHSLDRKVCNTLNTLCLPVSRGAEWVMSVLEAAEQAGVRRGQSLRLHVTPRAEPFLLESWWSRMVQVRRAEGERQEPLVTRVTEEDLGHEWEWEETPEMTLALVDSTEEAVGLFNRYSPQFVACLVGGDESVQQRFYEQVNAPFVGNGFTRWVDGQYALNRPELGLSNWQYGRLLARGAVLSGDAVFTVRTRVIQDDFDVHR